MAAKAEAKERREQAAGLMADRAYAALRDRLVTLDIEPGAPIDEERLGREFGMGRTPVREAIRRLALERLVVVYPRRGTFATEVNITDLAAISDLRSLLEGHAAQRAAERLTTAQRDELDELVAEIEPAVNRGDHVEVMGLDARIHRFIYRAAANPYLEEVLDRSLNLSLRIWHIALDRVPHLLRSVGEHPKLLAAIRDGESERARELASEHVEVFEREVRSVL
jgi:DNA-binding GntR family transcriptional regulator